MFDGIRKSSLSSADYIEIDYPDNRDVLRVLSAAAIKVRNTQLKDIKNLYSNAVVFGNAMIGWNYRLFAEDANTCSVGEGCDYVADKMHDAADQEVILILDKLLAERGAARKKGDPNEGPSMRYFFRKSAPYDFALTSDAGALYLELRIRNAQNCLAYLDGCPERIKEMFRHSDPGCQNRIDQTCRSGVRYEFEKEERWHCGCCGAPFKLHPVKEDIPHYLKLWELSRA